jgi:ABC-type antimicrobial peptide transport system permease subunit
MALGAHRGDVMRLVMQQGIRLAVIGAVIGLAIGAVVSRAMADVLFGVRPMDPLTFATATLVLGAAAFAGCYIPARRAVRLDPVTALRS